MASTPDELATVTDAAAAGPQSASVDGRSATQHAIRDLIALEIHRANQQLAASGSKPAVRFFNTKPPGAT